MFAIQQIDSEPDNKGIGHAKQVLVMLVWDINNYAVVLLVFSENRHIMDIDNKYL